MCTNTFRQRNYMLKDDALIFRHDGETFHLQGEKAHTDVRRIDVGCPTGKDTYPSYEAAEKAYRLKSVNGRREKRIYKCNKCGYWHFTTNRVSIKSRAYSRSHDREQAKTIIDRSLQGDSWILTDCMQGQRHGAYIVISASLSKACDIRMRCDRLRY